MNDVIPESIFAEIQKYVITKCRQAPEGWESAQEEEDTLTGVLGGMLRRKWTRQRLVNGKLWRWRITYSKFRGRGLGAAEKLIGADGIVEIRVEDLEAGVIYVKGILFQAKKRGEGRPLKIVEQAIKMEQVAPSGAAIFEYGPKEYSAYNARTVATERAESNPITQDEYDSLGRYLANRFMPCETGIRGMYYDAAQRTLYAPGNGGRLIRGALKHRFRIEVISG